MSTIIDNYSFSNQNAVTAISTNDAQNGIGTSFSVTTSDTLDRVIFNCSRDLLAVGNAYAKIYELTGTIGTNALPTGSAIATSNIVNVTNIPVSPTYAQTVFMFSNSEKIVLQDNHNYFLTIECTISSGNNKSLLVGIDTNTGNVGQNAAYLNSSFVWKDASSFDIPFVVYGTLGGYANANFLKLFTN